MRGIDKAFGPAVQGRALIATGTGGSGGRATVAIWTYAGGKMKHGIPFVMIQRVISTVSPQCIPTIFFTKAATGADLEPNPDQRCIVFPVLRVVGSLLRERRAKQYPRVAFLIL